MKIQEDLELDTSIVSEEDCPAAGEAIGTHYFRELVPNIPCNCTVCLIKAVKLPMVVILVRGISLVIDLRKQ